MIAHLLDIAHDCVGDPSRVGPEVALVGALLDRVAGQAVLVGIEHAHVVDNAGHEVAEPAWPVVALLVHVRPELVFAEIVQQGEGVALAAGLYVERQIISQPRVVAEAAESQLCELVAGAVVDDRREPVRRVLPVLDATAARRVEQDRVRLGFKVHQASNLEGFGDWRLLAGVEEHEIGFGQVIHDEVFVASDRPFETEPDLGVGASISDDVDCFPDFSREGVNDVSGDRDDGYEVGVFGNRRHPIQVQVRILAERAQVSDFREVDALVFAEVATIVVDKGLMPFELRVYAFKGLIVASFVSCVLM